jgi:hypothetical protein
MKKYSHAWLAFMAIKRLEQAKIAAADKKYADNLIQWFKDHRDDVIQGAWYPDQVIKDMATSHVLKITPSDKAGNVFKKLPPTYSSYQLCKTHPLKNRSFAVEKSDNLPDRCESIAHSVIDHLKMQSSEDRGSPVLPTNNQIALLLFMLSHYIADGHMPLHCDSRRFSEGANVHAKIESDWEEQIKRCYDIDKNNERFYYDPSGYPLKNQQADREYQQSFLKEVDKELRNRKFVISYGTKNKNVWDFMSAVCQYSYLMSYSLIPENYDHTNVPKRNWQALGTVAFDKFSVAVFADAIDSIARVWLRVWRRYMKWEKGRKKKKTDN